jgi:hypothetical protein
MVSGGGRLGVDLGSPCSSVRGVAPAPATDPSGEATRSNSRRASSPNSERRQFDDGVEEQQSSSRRVSSCRLAAMPRPARAIAAQAPPNMRRQHLDSGATRSSSGSLAFVTASSTPSPSGLPVAVGAYCEDAHYYPPTVRIHLRARQSSMRRSRTEPHFRGSTSSVEAARGSSGNFTPGADAGFTV